MSDDGITLELERADTADATAAQEAFFAEIATRYAHVPGAAVPVVHADELAAPDGAWIVVRLDGVTTGCGGLKRLDAETCEVKRVYLAPVLRGRGVARRLMAGLHDQARALGYTRARLDTGAEQPEAQRLYASLGYRAIPDYNGNSIASFWFEIDL